MKKYVGQHATTDHLKRYKSHIKASETPKVMLHCAIKSYGVDNFICEKLCEFPQGSLDNMECYYAEQFETYIWDNKPGYNMVWCGAGGRRGIKSSLEHIEKIRQALVGVKHTPERIEKMKQTKTGKKQSPEAIEVGRQSRIGKKHSPETIEKIRQANLNKIVSPETIEKLRQARLGKKQSPETVAKRLETIRKKKVE